jgi:hypothetical protein
MVDSIMSNVWPPVMDASTAKRRPEMSVEEWLNLPEDDEGELVSGRLEDEGSA